MPRLRRLSGAELVRIFRRFGFAVHSQRGSHIKMRRVGPEGAAETLTIPAHQEVKIGTSTRFFTKRSASSRRVSCGRISIPTDPWFLRTKSARSVS